MPNLNIPVGEELMRAIRVKAAAENLTRRDWVVKRLVVALISEYAQKEIPANRVSDQETVRA